MAWLLAADDAFGLRTVLWKSGRTPYDPGVCDLILKAHARLVQLEESYREDRSELKADLGILPGERVVVPGADRQERNRIADEFRWRGNTLKQEYEAGCSRTCQELREALRALPSDKD